MSSSPALLSIDWRVLPSLSCHSRHSSRPSIATGRPLERKRAQFSPWAPQTVTSKKFGLSTQSPVDWSLRRVLQATRKEHTEVPLDVERSSGSRVRLPVMMTRLMLVAATEGLLSTSLTYQKARWPSLGVLPATTVKRAQVATKS